MGGLVPDQVPLLHLGKWEGMAYYARHRLMNGWIKYEGREVAGETR